MLPITNNFSVILPTQCCCSKECIQCDYPTSDKKCSIPYFSWTQKNASPLLTSLPYMLQPVQNPALTQPNQQNWNRWHSSMLLGTLAIQTTLANHTLLLLVAFPCWLVGGWNARHAWALNPLIEKNVRFASENLFQGDYRDVEVICTNPGGATAPHISNVVPWVQCFAKVHNDAN
jgi:hypothetical protein